MNVIYAFIGSHPDYNGVASGKVMGGAQRLSESNGLLLCANHDKLFDQGYISFDCDGKMLISGEIPSDMQHFMNISANSRIELTDGMKPFMKYHREKVFKK